MEELVSVIVPVYNIEEYLPRCLACLEMQTYKNLEIILVDDGSTDDTGKICDEYAAKDPRARVIHHPENRGLWAARNTGQDAAHGEYLWFPDGDDYFHKDIIKVMVETINQTNDKGDKSDVAIVWYKQTTLLNEDIYYPLEIINTQYLSRDVMIKNLFKSLPDGFIWNKLFRSDLICNLRNHEYIRRQDFDFCFRAYLLVNTAIITDLQLYYYVRRSDSLISNTNHYFLFMLSTIQILYWNYMNLPNEGKKYEHFLLYSLYKYMVSAEGTFFTLDKRTEIIDLCNKVVRDTKWAYLRCSKVSLSERIIRILFVQFPRVTHFMFIIRKRIHLTGSIFIHPDY